MTTAGLVIKKERKMKEIKGTFFSTGTFRIRKRFSKKKYRWQERLRAPS
jgi:hypothetical protein